MDPSQDCADLNKSSGGSTTALAGVLKDTVVADFNLEEKQTHLLQKFGDITIDKLQISALFLFFTFEKADCSIFALSASPLIFSTTPQFSFFEPD